MERKGTKFAGVVFKDKNRTGIVLFFFMLQFSEQVHSIPPKFSTRQEGGMHSRKGASAGSASFGVRTTVFNSFNSCCKSVL